MKVTDAARARAANGQVIRKIQITDIILLQMEIACPVWRDATPISIVEELNAMMAIVVGGKGENARIKKNFNLWAQASLPA